MSTSGRPVVVDASVVLKWVLPERYSPEASMLRDDHLAGRVAAHAPDLVLLEAASALRKHVLVGDISGDDALEALDLIKKAGIVLEPAWSLAGESLRLALDLGVTPYDAAYIALALRLNAPFYTADERLLANSRVRSLGVARHIRDYATRPGEES